MVASGDVGLAWGMVSAASQQARLVADGGGSGGAATHAEAHDPLPCGLTFLLGV